MAEHPPLEVKLLNLCLRLLSVGTNGTPAHTTRAEVRYGRTLMWPPPCSIAQASFALLPLARARHRHLRYQSRPVAQTIPRRSCARRGYRLHPPRHVLPPGEEGPGIACFRRTRHLKSSIRARCEPETACSALILAGLSNCCPVDISPNLTLRLPWRVLAPESDPQYGHVSPLKCNHQSTLFEPF